MQRDASYSSRWVSEGVSLLGDVQRFTSDNSKSVIFPASAILVDRRTIGKTTKESSSGVGPTIQLPIHRSDFCFWILLLRWIWEWQFQSIYFLSCLCCLYFNQYCLSCICFSCPGYVAYAPINIASVVCSFCCLYYNQYIACVACVAYVVINIAYLGCVAYVMITYCLCSFCCLCFKQ